MTSFQVEVPRTPYSTPEPSYPGIISFIAQLALETIATSDAAYHDVNHTILVTSVGQEILRGRHISIGGVTPRDWLHFIVSLLCKLLLQFGESRIDPREYRSLAEL